MSVVFADVTDSTELAERLDPESFHDVLDRYSAACASAVERHGGRVEKYIGDAVVGLFGLPTVHEDDALRAVRAAVETRSAVAALSEMLMRERGIELGVAVGVNTGEVFRPGRTPVVGRFSLSGGNPAVVDSPTIARGLGLAFGFPGEQQWRMAMLNLPAS